ncbi:MAG: sulfatase-like hydrolase/transferase [Akkermansiaceae bacterium]|nr:sulfatase-like hydrolase/transferase [Akkermansiaceae bacterium]
MTSSASPSPGWHRFLTQLAMVVRLILWILVCLCISRGLLVWLNRHAMDGATTGLDYLEAMAVGLRFDGRIAAFLVTPSVILSALCLKFDLTKATRRTTLAAGFIFTILWLLLGTITLGYFREYHNQFDPHVLGVVYDDFDAVVQTIWKTYPVVRGILVLLALMAGLCWLMRRWVLLDIPSRFPAAPRALPGRIAWTLAILFVLVVGLRGAVKGRPVQEKDAGCTGDQVLNRCVVNPFFALHYAIGAHRRLMDQGGLDQYLDEKELMSAFREFAGTDDLKTVDDAFLKKAAGPSGPRPQHIFVVLLESYDGWTMMPAHAAWDIAPNMLRLGEEGARVTRFVAASRSTMTSLSSVISGLADAGVITNERSRPGQPPFATSVAAQMNGLGFETHFFYSGLGTWQRVEDFAKEQGFKHTHMGPDMPNSPGSNEWGVTDRDLYQYIEKTIRPDVPSFSVIMTASNHRPFSIDLAKEGCEVKVPATGYPAFDEGNATLRMLGHHKYSDKCVGEFVERMDAKAPGCFFALTADHWGRAFPGPRPTMMEQALVPLVLWQKGRTFPDLSGVGGSHYDLGATVIELVAPQGASYYAIGRNLLGANPPVHAQSRLWDIGPDSIVAMGGEGRMETLDGKTLAQPPADLPQQLRLYNLVHGLSWWRLIEGNEFPK